MKRALLAGAGVVVLVFAASGSSLADTGSGQDGSKKSRIFNHLRGGSRGDDVSAQAADTAKPDDKQAKKAAREEARLEEQARAGTGTGRKLDRVVAQLRGGPIGQDPSAVPYLDLAASGRANSAQLNDFAAWIARRGLIEEALEFQQAAIDIDRKNPTLWLNLGTMQSGLGHPGAAEAAFKRCLAIDPSNALAHYNLGVAYDAQRNYDAALESYRRALTLDPALADPRVNPQAVNNERLLAVRLMLSQEKAGALGLPLQTLQDKKPTPTPAPAPQR